MDALTTNLKNALAIQRSRFGAFRRACRALGAWARDGATPVIALRAAVRAFHNT